MRSGFRWLRFEPGLEAEYRAERFGGGLRVLRVYLAAALAILLAFIPLDYLILPAGDSPMLAFARYAIILPSAVLALAATWLPRAATWYPRIACVLAPLVLSAIALVVVSDWTQGAGQHFAVMLLASTVSWFLIGLPFFGAVAASLVAIAYYAMVGVGQPMPLAPLVYNVAIFLFSSGVCAAVAYRLDHTSRTAWLEARLLADFAMLDGLTGIANRRRFDEHLGRAWHQGVRENLPVSLLFADIDHFKAYNDRYGHQAGDEALRAVAGILSRIARRPLDLAARYGGEEFGVVLFGTAAKDALRIGETVLEEMRRLAIRHQGSAAGAVLTVSMGIATVMPTARRSFAGLVQLADQALYAAKDRGRNRVEVLEPEYEHMKTGYFRRHAGEGGGPAGTQ